LNLLSSWSKDSSCLLLLFILGVTLGIFSLLLII
jgi:hypothetical protein